ncbi:hypothetical protein MTR67_035125 [Solanum verrucosum]|uniref:Reverse transcriptase n=1 Tax=Solanum verrucosum TaxID=315347 RepID=A0AAF0U9A1_SOLVR|nr:hypothetical protein MTR67_035125 [Solanum verrucosum]
MVNEGSVLGHKIYGKGIQVDQDKVVVIARFPPPIFLKGVQCFLCHVGFNSHFIKEFSKVAFPLCKIIDKKSIFYLMMLV